MEKLVLLGINNRFTIKANLIAHVMFAIIFLFNGIFQVIARSFDPFGMIFGILMIIGSIFYLIQGFILFNPKSKYAPKVVVKENEIELKNKVFKPSIILLWKDIKKIEFGEKKLLFHLNDQVVDFRYNSNSDTSIDIKNLVRQSANEREIEVLSG